MVLISTGRGGGRVVIIKPMCNLSCRDGALLHELGSVIVGGGQEGEGGGEGK